MTRNSEAKPTDGSGDHLAILIICVECGEENWRAGPSFPLMCDYVESNFECEGCGRQLETGDLEVEA